AGQSQTGKSIFMGYAAIAMACGVPFGIFKGIQKSKVGYMALEDSSARINRRLVGFQEDLGVIPEQGQLSFWFAYNFSLSIDSISRMLRYIEMNNIDVIVIDTYQRATPGMSSFNDEKQSVIVQSLAKVCRETGCTIICIDHLRKLDERSKHYKKQMSLDDLKGSVAKVTNADTVLLMDRCENKLYLDIWSKDLDEDCHYVLDYSSRPKYQLTQD
ncbi:helicase RepA family protein, partial [bacterium]|nr:helicase RepA family protein [bacterium]